jgi:tetratricopeptide (TPR) repeat protein
MGDLELAEEHLSAALAVQPDDLPPLQALLDFYESTERPEDADAVIRSRLHSTVGSERRARLLRLHAQLLQTRGDHDGAIARLKEAFEDSPSEDLLADLSEHYEASGDWTSLQTCLYRAASTAAPDRAASIWLQLADLAETRLEDPELSRTALEEALASGTVNETIIGRLLEFYEDGIDDETDEVMARALDASESVSDRESVAQIQYLRGRIAELRDDTTVALQAYEASYGLSTSYLPNLMRLASLYYEEARYADALKTLRSALLHQVALQTDADRIALFLRLGELRYREGDESRAKDMFDRVLGLDPDNADAIAAIDAIDEGRSLF